MRPSVGDKEITVIVNGNTCWITKTCLASRAVFIACHATGYGRDDTSRSDLTDAIIIGISDKDITRLVYRYIVRATKKRVFYRAVFIATLTSAGNCNRVHGNDSPLLNLAQRIITIVRYNKRATLVNNKACRPVKESRLATTVFKPLIALTREDSHSISCRPFLYKRYGPGS